jgi:Domain of unknown function (DUF3597)
MGIFSSIKDAIFGHPAAAAVPPAPPPPAPVAVPTPDPATAEEVDARLQAIAASKGQPSNYKTSIVDLMKLLDLDSSFANRVTLAKELGFTGDTNDSATMNIWLHKQVMESLGKRGG